jgi:hypothetical protein
MVPICIHLTPWIGQNGLPSFPVMTSQQDLVSQTAVDILVVTSSIGKLRGLFWLISGVE